MSNLSFHFHFILMFYISKSFAQQKSFIFRFNSLEILSDISSIIKELSFDIDYGFYFMNESEDNIYRKLLNEKGFNIKLKENYTDLKDVVVGKQYPEAGEVLLAGDIVTLELFYKSDDYDSVFD